MKPDTNNSQALWKPDLAPTNPSQRTWRWYHFTALWIGMVMSIPAYLLASELITSGMSWWQVALTILIANPIVLVALVILVIDTISVNLAANLVDTAYDFSALNPKRISYKQGGFITAIIAILMRSHRRRLDGSAQQGVFDMSARRRIVQVCLAAIPTAILTGSPLAALAQAKLKVAAVYTVPYEQQWVSRVHNALKVAEARGEIEYKSSENVVSADYERVMREYASGGVQLMFGEVFGVEAAARKVAKDFPKMAIVAGSSGKIQAPNFSVFDNYIQEPAYLTGMIAGGMTKSGKIGMVGGFPIPEVNRLMHAFMAGAKETNPKVEFTVTFINSWFDPPKAKEAAFAMIDKGVDVLYAERFGVSDAAKARGKLAIGNVINTQDKYPDTVVASALWHMEPSVDRAIKAVKDGTYKAQDYGPYSMMKYQGSSLAPLGTFEKKVPTDLIAKVKAKEADILAGKFTVKVDDSQPKSTAK